jgi:transporter family protein
MLIPAAVLTSAFAQIILKKGSGMPNWSKEWVLLILLSGALYGISFFIYLSLLRLHPISKIYPILTITVIIIITIYGFLIGEKISLKHFLGIVMGIGSVLILLS